LHGTDDTQIDYYPGLEHQAWEPGEPKHCTDFKDFERKYFTDMSWRESRGDAHYSFRSYHQGKERSLQNIYPLITVVRREAKKQRGVTFCTFDLDPIFPQTGDSTFLDYYSSVISGEFSTAWSKKKLKVDKWDIQKTYSRVASNMRLGFSYLSQIAAKNLPLHSGCAHQLCLSIEKRSRTSWDFSSGKLEKTIEHFMNLSSSAYTIENFSLELNEESSSSRKPVGPLPDRPLRLISFGMACFQPRFLG
jgi:hypothetical protein